MSWDDPSYPMGELRWDPETSPIRQFSTKISREKRHVAAKIYNELRRCKRNQACVDRVMAPHLNDPMFMREFENVVRLRRRLLMKKNKLTPSETTELSDLEHVHSFFQSARRLATDLQQPIDRLMERRAILVMQIHQTRGKTRADLLEELSAVDLAIENAKVNASRTWEDFMRDNAGWAKAAGGIAGLLISMRFSWPVLSIPLRVAWGMARWFAGV